MRVQLNVTSSPTRIASCPKTETDTLAKSANTRALNFIFSSFAQRLISYFLDTCSLAVNVPLIDFSPSVTFISPLTPPQPTSSKVKKQIAIVVVFINTSFYNFPWESSLLSLIDTIEQSSIITVISPPAVLLAGT